MAEYIEREAVCKNCKNINICTKDDKCPVIKTVAADVAPVVHGEWVEYENEQDRGFHYCSCCKAPAFNYLDGSDICEILSKHCYDCGAKMDGERKGDDAD